MTSTLERRVVTLAGVPVGAGPAVVIGGRVSLRDGGAAPVTGGAWEVLPDRATLVEPSSAGDLPAVAARADGVVVGASWTRDIPLVRAVAALGLPVVVERRPSASLEEWLGLAAYCAAEGNDQVILCEGGRPDLALLRAAREASGRPVVADVRHDTGLSAAAIAAGADGVIVAGPVTGGVTTGGIVAGPVTGEVTTGGDAAGAVTGEVMTGGDGAGAGVGGADPAGAHDEALEAVTLVGALLRPETPGTLAGCREAIDRVDAALATLLERRAALAGIVQTLKPVGGFAGRDAARERALVARMALRAPELGESRLAAIMNAVIEAGLDLAEERRQRP
jgi:chorismate mutase